MLQRLFLNRGEWSEVDLQNEIDGIQALNSGFSQAWKRAKILWLKMLTDARKVPLLAGNDAHGDFNRYRAVQTPFLSIYENFQRFMGYGKTGIYGTGNSAGEIFQKIKDGATFISTGPYISINYSESHGDYAVGNQNTGKSGSRLFVHSVSTLEFGRLHTLSVFYGYSSSPEKLLFATEFDAEMYENVSPIDGVPLLSASYIRAEITTRCGNGDIFRAYTSACWL
ncbi:MAG: hypothetical protein JW863_23185 [Chitinispirillaceae bacterium]|nr:hypothetical protein [Chitinispirillaceae bacterium]